MKSRILLIDPNTSYRRALTSRLTREGFEAIGVPSGRAGLQASSEKAPDLVLLAMRLPAPDGVETFQAFRTRRTTRHIPMILLTDCAVTDYWTPLEYDPEGPTFVMQRADDRTLLLARINELLSTTRAVA